MTQWDFQNKGKSRWTGTSSFVLKVPLRHLRSSVIYSVPCDRILQRAYCSQLLIHLQGPIHLRLSVNTGHYGLCINPLNCLLSMNKRACRCVFCTASKHDKLYFRTFISLRESSLFGPHARFILGVSGERPREDWGGSHERPQEDWGGGELGRACRHD